jgi:hypothetical protein
VPKTFKVTAEFKSADVASAHVLVIRRRRNGKQHHRLIQKVELAPMKGPWVGEVTTPDVKNPKKHKVVMRIIALNAKGKVLSVAMRGNRQSPPK